MNCCIAAAWSVVPAEREVFGELGCEDVAPPPAWFLPLLSPPVPRVRAAKPSTATATSSTTAATQGHTGRRRRAPPGEEGSRGVVASSGGSAATGGTPTGDA